MQNIDFKNRRRLLLKNLLEREYSEEDGVILLFANFENEYSDFLQESSFFYLTGIEEPAIAFASYFEKGSIIKEVVYVPYYNKQKQLWCDEDYFAPNNWDLLLSKLLVDEIKYIGKQCKSFTYTPFFTTDKYEILIKDLKLTAKKFRNFKIYSVFSSEMGSYFTQWYLLHSLMEMEVFSQDQLINCASVVHKMRRFKSREEVSFLKKAVEITKMAFETVTPLIEKEQGYVEHDIAAYVDFIFKRQFASTAFPSIIASGNNGVILHHGSGHKVLQKGELVIVDIGSRYNGYAADISRTFCVGGNNCCKEKQRELYKIVYDTQQYLIDVINDVYKKKKLFLYHPTCYDCSLHHLAFNFLQKRGYGEFLLHKIGHFLGLDVHEPEGEDFIPLSMGDVFTLEPGLYLKNLGIGVRIEDDFLIDENGFLVCLSAAIPKDKNL